MTDKAMVTDAMVRRASVATNIGFRDFHVPERVIRIALEAALTLERGEAEETPAKMQSDAILELLGHPPPVQRMTEIDRLRAALSVAWMRMRNARGAVESNQVIDKDVRGTLTRGIEEIDAVLSHTPTPSPNVVGRRTPEYEAAETAFTGYFVKNYPGPDTIIFDPGWHAPKLFSAAAAAIRNANTMSAATTEAYCAEGAGDDDLKECFLHHVRTTIGFLAFGARTGPEMTMYEEGFKAGYRRCQSDNEPELGEEQDDLTERARKMVGKLRMSIKAGAVELADVEDAIDLIIDQASPSPQPNVEDDNPSDTAYRNWLKRNGHKHNHMRAMAFEQGYRAGKKGTQTPSPQSRAAVSTPSPEGRI